MQKKILVANNGLSAVKFIRSVKKDTNNYNFVGLVSQDDLVSNSKFVEMLDEIELVSGGSSLQNYGNVDLIVKTAKKHGCDAVWPGWGHASEKPELPRRLKEEGITFIGPSAESMHALGDKICSTIIAQKCKVPTLPWNGGHIVDLKDIDQVNIKNGDECVLFINQVGLPVMIKASEGGGGKGIRSINTLDPVVIKKAYEQVCLEVPNSPVFVTKLIDNARHIEVQLAADLYGNVVSLSGRDCSIQRRHQKIIEEGPPIIVDPIVWVDMQQAACRLAKEVGYAILGTVEFLYVPETKQYYFLELNPRLQVEHTVTELVMDMNLPLLQVELAFGMELEPQEAYQPLEDRHVIACRLTSENDLFKPSIGTIDSIYIPKYEYSLSYTSIDKGELHQYADSQFAHVFTIAETRDHAIERMSHILDQTCIYGTVPWPKNMLHFILNDVNVYKSNIFHTKWLDIDVIPTFQLKDDHFQKAILCAIRSHVYFNHEIQNALDTIKKGHELEHPLSQTHREEFALNDVNYSIETIWIEKDKILVDGFMLFTIVGVSSSKNDSNQNYKVIYDSKVYNVKYINEKNIFINNDKYLLFDMEDTSVLKTNTSGTFVRYLIDNEGMVEKNQAYAEIEVMKMNMELISNYTGKITHVAKPGSILNLGDVVCQMEAENVSTAKIVESLFVSNKPFHFEPIPKIVETSIPIHTYYQQMLTNSRKNDEWLFQKPVTVQSASKTIPKSVNYWIELFARASTSAINYNFLIRSDGITSVVMNVGQNLPFVLTMNNTEHKNGAFGLEESKTFYESLKYARKHRLPFVYISNTVGAKLGIYEKLKDHFKIKVSDNEFEYLYLEKETYEELFQDTVDVEWVSSSETSAGHYKINAILGEKDDSIGVESLMGSGMTAGEMSRAYNDILTITYIAGTCVGIGAYLARLSQRVIQKKDSPMLLTGYSALNSLIGKQLYKSNLQLGGANEIMNLNGIAQLMVDDDLQGIKSILKWLEVRSFRQTTPHKQLAYHGHALNKLSSYQVLSLFTTEYQEYMQDWAKTVVTVRGVLYGKTWGIIIPQHNSVTLNEPCDPGDPMSTNQTSIQAGCVLYPDSSFKMAQFINDCNVEKIPLLILANWRGFSGGARDMYKSVLKYGSHIVDALTKYNQNIYVYVYGELRGGSWVVLDSTINDNNKMQMYAHPDSMGGVLEPSGLVKIKYRSKDIEKMMSRLDLTDETLAQQAAKEYATLHDKPQRMKHVGAIKDIVDLEQFKDILKNN